MTIRLHKNFLKQYQKLTEKEKRKFKVRRDLFLQDEFSPALNNHPLKGRYSGYRSINVTGDLRVIYKKESQGKATFVIGSHSELYR